MVDKNIIMKKTNQISHCLKSIEKYENYELEQFLNDCDEEMDTALSELGSGVKPTDNHVPR